MDNSDMHCVYEEIRDQSGDPIARLTPLGWTCVVRIRDSHEILNYTHYNRTYFIHNQKRETETDKILRKFWEVECYVEGEQTV